ncbi:glycosyltransferase [Sphingomonas sp. AOB5]|uniref:glycosyltransferase n=1 Tax=Sphingomonas sp. AOB5 TaxID=3034017 RepID=UPI0023F8355F|nr:glycosyltransferase [Sphingomonas sp. AOB5]MDF7776696.1 glycosyltransferase [Sphingomonas sp. AOB5]
MPQCNRFAAGRIVAFAQSLRGGGVERALLRMAGGWHAQGREIILVIGDATGPLARELPPGVPVRELGNASYAALRRESPRIVRELRPDLIFCPGNHYSAVAGWTRLALGRDCPPIVAKVSNALVRPDMGGIEAWGYRRWLRLHPLFLDSVVAMTQATAAEAVREMRLPADRVSVIANPPALHRPDAEAVAIPEGRYILGVGRLEAQKRWDRLIAALPKLADRQVKLVILGEGSLRETLTAQAAALGLADRVSMPGHAADPLPVMAGAALVALTSDYEGVPGVLREALAQGTPVVATDSSVSVREIVASPTLGSVIARDDAEGLVAALDRWLSPGAVRPAPTAHEGDPIAEYLALFDRVVAQRRGE